MRLSIPKWAGMVEAAAWLVLSVALAWTGLWLFSLVVRVATGTFVFANGLRDRSLAEIPWVLAISVAVYASPAIIGFFVAGFAQGTTLVRQKWLVRLAAWNLVASLALSLIGLIG
jgi:hypothetical protein